MKIQMGAGFKRGSPGNLRMLISKGENKKMLDCKPSIPQLGITGHSWPRGRTACGASLVFSLRHYKGCTERSPSPSSTSPASVGLSPSSVTCHHAL